MEEDNIKISDKVLKYETFINDVLKEDLRIINLRENFKTEELSQWIQLKATISSIQDLKLSKLKTKMDIGSTVFAQAVVEDPSKILIDIGAKIYMEFTLPEALCIVNSRINLLETQIGEIRQLGWSIKARINLVLQGIRELEQIK